MIDPDQRIAEYEYETLGRTTMEAIGEDEHLIEGQFCGVNVEFVEPDDYQR